MLLIEELHKRFSNGFIGLGAIDLTVNRSEIISLIGTSGCGKSTILRIIAGLSFPSSGTVRIDDQIITKPHPEISIIFQESRLMPWLTVWENIQFGLQHLPKTQRNLLTGEIIEKVGLTQFAKALPKELSGGMAQRVAIARALVTNPSILLLDEPFSALDAFTRLSLQDHLLQIWEYDRPTMILVTHDVEEALMLSDRVIVMRGNPGRIHQEFEIDLPRPRRRTDSHLQYWKEQLLEALDLSTGDRLAVEAY
jgi:sulfonate transport system ATP-binding protein